MLVSFLEGPPVIAQLSLGELETNWGPCNYEGSYIVSRGRHSRMHLQRLNVFWQFKRLYWDSRRGRLLQSALLPWAWQALSFLKLDVAPWLLKCKFEKHHRGGKHQHVSHKSSWILEAEGSWYHLSQLCSASVRVGFNVIQWTRRNT